MYLRMFARAGQSDTSSNHQSRRYQVLMVVPVVLLLVALIAIGAFATVHGVGAHQAAFTPTLLADGPTPTLPCPPSKLPC
jgi:NADH:ubiquinone oxidoreductase subunit 5 (subunit L)/multisubunit Na+/H+ antiporter MnhA subunit